MILKKRYTLLSSVFSFRMNLLLVSKQLMFEKFHQSSILLLNYNRLVIKEEHRCGFGFSLFYAEAIF